MKKFKLKKIRITTLEKIIVFFILGLLIILIPLNSRDKEFLNKNEIVKEKINPSEVIKSFNFEGELKSLNIFDNKYASVLYTNADSYKGHLINLETRKEVFYDDFIKEEEKINFNNKIHELLLLKYPSKIVDILESSENKEYSFEDSELVIYYYPANLNTTREFVLHANYNEIYQFLNFEVKLDENYTNESGFDLDPNKITISFTFDDGPNNKKTMAILNALEDYKMSATFFMVGYKLENDAETVKNVSLSHSDIGYHSYKHNYFTKQTAEIIQKEFKISDDMLYSITGKHFTYTRPPYGAYNQKTLNAIDNAFIRWNIDTNDWRYKDADYIENHVLNNIENGNIILFHDSYDTSVEAVLRLLEQLYLKDIQVTNVANLANLRNITLENHQVYYDFK